MRKLPSKTMEKDKVIGTAIDGSKLRSRPLHQMVRFLSTDRFDAPFLRNEMANFFNDGVIKREILESGLGDVLAKAYFEELKEELGAKIKKFQQFRSYEHPHAPYISIENLYAGFMPGLVQNLTRLRALENIDSEAFPLLAKIYVDHSRIQPEMVRKILYYQQNQGGRIERDPRLETEDFSLFHAHSLEDWFGRRFLELCCQFIHNSALYAKQSGYQVTAAEARAELLQNGYQALSEMTGGKDLNHEDFSNYSSRILYALGLSEKEAVDIWQKVMLMRRMLQDVAGSAVMDNSLWNDYFSYVNEEVNVDVYKLPEELVLQRFWDLLELQTYLEGVSKNADLASLPKDHLPLQEIIKKAPELVQQRYLVKMSQTSLKEVAQRIGLKEMWNWETHWTNWEKIQKEFPQLAGSTSKSQDERLEELERLDPTVRMKIDEFSRKEMVKEHGDWIEEALAQKEQQKKVIAIPEEGALPLEGIADNKALLVKLEEGLQKKDSLSCISFDGNTYYRIEVQDKKPEKEILTFKEAKQKGILSAMLEQKLQLLYPSIRTKHPESFLKEDGNFKPFYEVKEEVGRWAYQDLLKKIKQTSGAGSANSIKEPLEHYAAVSLLPWIQELRKKASENVAEIVKTGETEVLFADKPGFAEQWKLLKESTSFQRKDIPEWITEKTFALPELSWSEVFASESGRHLFFQIISHQKPEMSSFEKQKFKSQHLLADEAKKEFIERFIEKCKEKQAIHLAKENAEDLRDS
ncbi:MAG: hypothetical protein Tsb0015_12390 [Simkaniaceae bacterium]